MGHLWAHCRPINNVQSNLILATTLSSAPKKKNKGKRQRRTEHSNLCDSVWNLFAATITWSWRWRWLRRLVSAALALSLAIKFHWPISAQYLAKLTHTHTNPFLCKVFFYSFFGQPANNVNRTRDEAANAQAISAPFGQGVLSECLCVAESSHLSEGLADG